MLNDLRPEQRKNIINTPADDTEKKALDDLMTFIISGSPNIFETSLLPNSRPFGISNVYGKLTSITKGPVALYACFLFSFYVFSAIIFHQNVYYIKIGDIKYARQGGALAPGLNAVHPMTLVFTIFFMWSIPVWHFVLMVLVYIMLLYYAFKRASRIAALKMAAQQEISKNPTPLNG